MRYLNASTITSFRGRCFSTALRQFTGSTSLQPYYVPAAIKYLAPQDPLSKTAAARSD
ncbi:hypothetical protein M404DRAFT_1005883 [Pisolithus tinctorius Marx 270]|uniref:Uncharacterized protein n=1 Tax=Pisolithus tinctorius Marx 270 TaxID=870435 RepID=A0A0C3JJE3_PISTI|nr:hypothetical protein M404DRAFT_1005883 [Pisolithus tinctorius Marx 270]